MNFIIGLLHYKGITRLNELFTATSMLSLKEMQKQRFPCHQLIGLTNMKVILADDLLDLKYGMSSTLLQ